MSKDQIAAYFENALRLQVLIHTGEDDPGPVDLTEKPKGHYGEWCRDPKACAGKGYCPLDPNCAD